MAALLTKVGGASYQQFCGGSLFNNLYVLTAAHCIIDSSPEDLAILLADHALSVPNETPRAVRAVTAITPHPSYNPKTSENDIAILRLDRPVTFAPDLLPVCLPPYGVNYAGFPSTVAGWGTTVSNGKSTSDVLLKVDLPIMSNSACNSKYNPEGQLIYSTMLCAAAPGKDSCQGDSGGPLITKNTGGTYDQIGVVSFGVGCADPKYPGVYTRVDPYIDWIMQNTGANGGSVYCASNAPTMGQRLQ